MIAKRNKGFTLIELLVVIAIIGILSSVVLASLTVARNKGKDSAIQANLNTIRSEIELYYVGGESYGTPAAANALVCDQLGQPFVTVTNIANAITSAEESSSGEAICAIGLNGATWAVSVPLNSGGSWCVKDIGAGGLGTASDGGGSAATCS